jgi:pimeloyl-ACP methyl ester carboxylesterase
LAEAQQNGGDPESFELELSSGLIYGERRGAADAPLVLCLHGVSANVRGFDFIAPRLADSHRVVAVDLRGRGRSEITPPGTYGLDAHVRDALEIADLLGAERFDLVGWSMGACIGIALAEAAAERVRRLVLIDHLGPMEDVALAAVESSFARLDAVVDTPEEYVAAVRAAGAIAPWSGFWERYFRYELRSDEPPFRPSTDRAACLEDAASAARSWHALWPALTMPTLLLRCKRPIGGGFIVPACELEHLRRLAPGVEIAEVDADHYGVMTSPVAADAIVSLLAR